MKNIIYCFIISVLFVSCQKQTKDTVQVPEKTNSINKVSDLESFIGAHKAQTMVLGVFHFSNPGLDEYKTQFSFDKLEPKRQEELNVLLEKIAKYKPTKILLEWNRIKTDSLANMRYQEFLKGTYDISEKANEVFQIGFKLAKKLGHTKIYCIDASAKWLGVELDWDNYDKVGYLKSKGQYKKSTRYDYNAFYRLNDSLKTVQTLSEHFLNINNPQHRLKGHQAYLTDIVLEGAGDNYLGADHVTRWYRRNLRMFANAYDVTDFNKEERLLILVGYGHVWQLRQYFTDSPDFDYVESIDYLK